MKKLCVLVFSVASIVALGQSADPTQPDIIPPSPEAANLGKYVEIPVSYNTGTPQIEIPLYEINVNDMKIPIGLSYHAGGIKVTEVASWVGSGWSLNAGGVITRVMRGRPDEGTYGYFTRSQWDSWQAMKGLVLPEPVMGVDDQASQRQAFQIKVANGEIDLQPDIFYFNFGTYAGKIVFDLDKNPVIIPYQDLKISAPFNGANQWVITTPDGIQYIFNNGDAERTTPLNEGQFMQSPFYSTWYLSEVRSLKQPGFISFAYGNNSLNGIETSPVSGVVLGRLDNLDKDCKSDAAYPQSMGTNQYSITTKYLTGINYTNGSILFSSTADRLDQYQNNVTYTGRKLNGITVFGTGLNTVKTVSFIYDYSTNRLTLTSLQETGKSPYRFAYTGSLPDPGSYAQDHWGYYNGATSNLSLIPAMTVEEAAFYRPNAEYGGIGRADRSPKLSANNGALVSITYPTGGKRVFNYELHEVYGQTATPQNFEAEARGAIMNTNMNLYEQGQYNYFITQQYQIAGGPVNVRSSSVFSVTPAQYVTLTFSATSSGGGAVADVAQFHVYKVEGGAVNYDQPVAFDRNGTMLFQEGDYILIAAASQSTVTVKGSISFTRTTTQNNPIGGLRVSSIEDMDNGQTVNKLTFNYHQPIVNSGKIASTPPGASQPSTAEYFYPIVDRKKTACGRLYLASHTLDHGQTFEGSHIGYKRVEVYQYVAGTSSSYPNGSTVYIYDNNINDIMRGQLTDVIFLNQARDTVKHTKYIYNFQQSDNRLFSNFSPAIEMERTEHVIDECHLGANCATKDYYKIAVTEKRYTTFFPYQTQITEKIFSKTNYPQFSATRMQVTCGLEGPYEESHTFPTEIVKTTSTSDKTVELFSYQIKGNSAPDVKVPTMHWVLREMNGQRNLINVTATEYRDNLPIKIKSYRPATPVPYDDDAAFSFSKIINNSYADKKLTLRYASDDVMTSYIWDLAKLNPIAEIVNCSSPTDAAYTGFENDSNEGNWTYTFNNGAMGMAGDQCHSFLSGAGITKSGLKTTTSYKVSFWAKNGDPSVNNVISSDDDPNADADGWKFYSKIISGTTSVTVTGATGILIDELRIHPVGARMTTMTYRNGVGITSKTDADGKVSFYEYDPAGRLIYVRDHNKKVLQNFDYYYRSN